MYEHRGIYRIYIYRRHGIHGYVHNKDIPRIYHFTHVCSHSCSLPLLLSPLSSSPVLLNVGVGSAVLEEGVGVIAHGHHSDGVVGPTVQSCQVVVGAITCSVD